MSNRISKYGLRCNTPDFTQIEQELVIEMEAIRRGGHWKESEIEQGLGLQHHYKAACQLIWPWIDWHRWTELCNQEIRRDGAKVTVLMGPGSTCKTNSAGWEYLLEYYCSPDDTLVLISSTDIRGLELRVLGEIKMLHERAIERFPWLPGNLIDSKHCIATDDLDEDDIEERIKARDLRRGVMGIPTVQGGKSVGLGKWQGIKQKHVRLIADDCTAMSCFPKGTLVDTPRGKIPIEKIKRGDRVFSAIGIDVVKNTMTNKARCLIRITTKDGRKIVCTPNHPIFTQFGWKRACNVGQSCYIVSTYEGMRFLRGKLPTDKQQQMLSEMPGRKSIFGLSSVWKNIQKRPIEFARSVLQSVLRRKIQVVATRIQEEVLYKIQNRKDSVGVGKKIQGKPGSIQNNEGKGRVGIPAVFPFSHPKTVGRTKFAHSEQVEVYWPQTGDTRRERNWPDKSRKPFDGFILSLCQKQLSGENRETCWQWLSNKLQGGHRLSRIQVGGGGRWPFPQQNTPPRTGCEKNELANGSWVDSVEIYEPENFRGYSKRKGRIEVYNLEVEKHPSYSVSGFLVHNSTFLSAFANLNNNVDFQAIICFNPDDILDPGGVAAEPKDGWSGHLEPTKTTVWDTKFFNGRCVNLVGLDSPNFDYPQNLPPRYPYLVSQKKIDETISAFGKDSFEYFSQCLGIMKISQMSRRVITRDLCKQFHALDGAVWDGSENTLIGATDAAYGGDRCVGGHAEFGRCMDGKIRLQFYPPHIVPVRSKSGEPMAEEDSISAYEKNYFESQEVKPENFFHDSTGRGSLGTSLSRIWSSKCNPVEFGGAPTKRPVTMDTFTDDKKTGEHRLKRCDEHYFKFVSEMWFSLRYAIEADQIRGLPEDVMNELCSRIWERVANDKIAVESKLEMKERTRKSPDLGDWAAIILEGARRRGFAISKLSNSESEAKDDGYSAENLELDSILQGEMLART